MIPPYIFRLKALGIGIGIFIGSFLILSPILNIEPIDTFLDMLDGYCYDRLFYHNFTPTSELVIIDLDTPLPTVNRNLCARLIKDLNTANAKIIGFDIRFPMRLDKPGDDLLVSMTEAFDNVIHVFCVSYGTGLKQDLEEVYLRRQALDIANDICPLSSNIEEPDGIELPFPELFQVTKDIAHINFYEDNDSGIRRFPLFICYKKMLFLSLPLKLVCRFLNIDESNIKIQLLGSKSNETYEDNLIVFKTSDGENYEIPIDFLGQSYIKFIKRNKFKIHKIGKAVIELEKIKKGYSFDNPFDNKIVLIVNSGNQADHSSKNPLLMDSMPHWIIHASIISQILKKEYITESTSSMFSFSLISVLIILIWLILIEIRIKNLKRRAWLVLLFGVIFLLLAARINLFFGNWPTFIMPGIFLCVSYLPARCYLYKWIPPSPPQYQNFDLQIQKKSEIKYLVDVISSPVGEEAEGEFTLRKKELEELIKSASLFHFTSTTRDEVKKFGTKLFNYIFPQQIRRRFDQSLGSIKDIDNKYLRIRLRIEPSELSALPWEFLYDPIHRKDLVLWNELSLVRYPLIPQKIETIADEPPLKILIIISNPSDREQLNIENEKKRIKKALRNIRWKRMVKLTFLKNTTIDKVKKKINKYHVIHYVGHGGFRESSKGDIGCLVFENGEGKSHLVDAESLVMLLSRKTFVKIFFLNACETAKSSTYDAFLSVATNLINAGVPAVIAMQLEVPDQSAITFSEEFYKEVAKNHQIDAAMNSARKALAVNPGMERIDWGIPVLFMRAPDGIIFKQM